MTADHYLLGALGSRQSLSVPGTTPSGLIDEGGNIMGSREGAVPAAFGIEGT